MEFECIQCPPINFLSHDLCHSQYEKYIEICERVKEDKEDIHPFFNTKIHEWKLALTSLFYLCSTEAEYLRYGRRLKEFNIVFDLVLKEGTALIYQPNNETWNFPDLV